MSLARETARQSFVLAAARTAGIVTSLVSVVFFTRILSPKEMAVVPVLTILVELVFTVSNLGLGLSVARRLPAMLENDVAGALDLGGAFAWATCCGGVVGCGLMAMQAEWIATLWLKDPSAGWWIRIGVLSILSGAVQRSTDFLLRGTSRFGLMSMVIIASQVLRIIVPIPLYFVAGMPGFLVGVALASLLPTIPAVWALREYFRHVPRWRAFRGHVRESVPFYLEGYVNYAVRFADQWLIGLFLQPVDLATYYVPRMFFDRAMNLVQSVRMVLLTTISRLSTAKTEVLARAFHRMQRAHLYLFGPCSLGFLVSSYWIVDLLAGPRYREQAAAPFALLAVSFFVLASFSPQSLGLVVLGRPRQRLATVVVQAVAVVVCLPVLTYSLGLSGAALARIAGITAMELSSWWLLRRIIPMPIDRVAIRTLLLPAAVFAGIALGGQWLWYSRLTAPLFILAGALAFGALFVRRTEEEDMQTLASILPRRLSGLITFLERMRPAPVGNASA